MYIYVGIYKCYRLTFTLLPNLSRADGADFKILQVRLSTY